MALQLRQELALFWVPQDDLLVIPAARKNLAVGRPGNCIDTIAAIFSNVREHICNGRLRLSPLNLRLSPPDRGRIATLRKMRSPVALEHLELLATSKIPQADRLVIRRTDEQLRIRGAELDATDVIAAISSNVRFLVNFSTPLPPESTPLPP